ncbi:hypothetical protein IAU60_004747 [Kwoniella sp. DSM 27419]
MSSPTPASVSQRLTTTSSLLLERSRILSLNLKPSPSSTSQIIRNLTAIRGDLDQLHLESEGLAVGGGGGPTGKSKRGSVSASAYGLGVDEGEVEELGQRYDRLLEMLGEDEVGKEKAKTLQRIKREPTPPPSPPASTSRTPAPPSIQTTSLDPPLLHVEPPTPAVNVRFRDFPDDDPESQSQSHSRTNTPSPNPSASGSASRSNPTITAYKDDSDEDEPLNPHEMLSSQQAMMDDQDERLNLLSNSIGRQNHLSIQIGSELDIHHQLLEDTDAAMDRTSASLGRARRRMDKVANDAKQHGSTITIVVLIFILLILIIVFKT